MRARPLVARVLAATLLAGLAVWRAAAPDDAARPDQAPAVSMPSTAPPVPASARADTRRLRADVATVLARPLFRDGRRPPSLARDAADPGATTEGLPRLSGILFDGTAGAAIFEGAGKPRVTRVGDRIGPYVVAAITPTDVVVRGPDGERHLRPTYSARPAVAAITARPSMPSLIDALMHGERRLPLPPPPAIGDPGGRDGPVPAR